MKLQYLLQPILILRGWLVRICYRRIASGSDRWDYVSQFGVCEQRIAMSAMPWLPIDIVPSDLLHPADVSSSASPASLDLHAPVSIFEQTIAPVHQQTGWNQVQSQFGLNGHGQTVAIIDSGIAFDHMALGRGYGVGYRVVGGWDFAEGDNRPYDDAPAGYHGTHVAGIVGANDGVRFGVAPKVDFVALRVFNDTGRSELAWTESALRWVYENRNSFSNPITTVNLSLGASWNSNTVPGWAQFEDELAQLQQAGIVVVASAGNSFQQYKAPGLAYPAASPYVIPVGSIDSNGSLSDFSQRDARMIAAPGRSIESTVPDYFFGKDGNPNDWAISSGTSMAAPYVAGASVLIREAMELAGFQDIRPQSIYETLRNTANHVFDTITNQSYRVLDLDRAIESILPKDTVGDTLPTGESMQMQSSWTKEGWINTLNDQDVYRINASESGKVTLRFESDHLEDQTISVIRNGLETRANFIDGPFQFQVTAGETVGLKIADGHSIGKYKLNGSFESASEGRVAEEGRLPSFASIHGDQLTIRGTQEVNKIQLDLSQGVRADVDGVSYQWNGSEIRRIVIDGAQNNDTIRIIGSSLADRVDMRPGELEFLNERLSLRVSQVENVQFVGGGGPDRAYLYDASTDDRLSIYPNRAELTGVGYAFSVEQVNRIFVHAVLGGDDQAFVYDSIGDDSLSVRPQFTSLAGEQYFNYLSGFERVFAYANNGGVDQAKLYDSAGNDLFSTSGEVTSIVGNGFSTFARGFEVVEAYSNAGGTDRALIHVPSEGRLLSGVDYVGMECGLRSSIARNFEQIENFLSGNTISLPGGLRSQSAEDTSELPTWHPQQPDSVWSQPTVVDIPRNDRKEGSVADFDFASEGCMDSTKSVQKETSFPRDWISFSNGTTDERIASSLFLSFSLEEDSESEIIDRILESL